MKAYRKQAPKVIDIFGASLFGGVNCLLQTTKNLLI